MNETLLWLDDFRDPANRTFLLEYKDVVWVKNYEEFVEYIKYNELPETISFDHDLADIEEWRDVVGFENLYKISNFGRVLSCRRNTTPGGYLKPDKNLSGLSVKLYKNSVSKKVTIHKLVAEAFLENNKNKKTINHKDGNRWNNLLKNLEWNTLSENIKHSHDNLDRNFYSYAENHKNSKTISQYDKDNNLIQVFGSVHEASRKLNIPFTNIAKCARGERKTSGGFIWKYENKKNTVKATVDFIPKEERNYTERFFIPELPLEKTGLDCAKYLIEECIERGKKLPNCVIHSMNPIGAKNIKDLLLDYKKYENIS